MQKCSTFYWGKSLVSTLMLVGLQALGSFGFAPVAIAISSDEIRNVTTLIQCGTSFGSGVFISREGNSYAVLTANHVVKGSSSCNIVTADGTRIQSSDISKLANIDGAVLRFSSSQEYPTVRLGDSERVKELSTVYVAGFPSPGTTISARSFTITKGEIASRGKYDSGYGLVYSNITREGMSGGPVLDENGSLIGMHGRAEGRRTADGTPVPAGLNLGIPVQEILPKVRSLIANQSPPVETQVEQPRNSQAPRQEKVAQSIPRNISQSIPKSSPTPSVRKPLPRGSVSVSSQPTTAIARRTLPGEPLNPNSFNQNDTPQQPKVTVNEPIAAISPSQGSFNWSGEEFDKEVKTCTEGLTGKTVGIDRIKYTSNMAEAQCVCRSQEYSRLATYTQFSSNQKYYLQRLMQQGRLKFCIEQALRQS